MSEQAGNLYLSRFIGPLIESADSAATLLPVQVFRDDIGVWFVEATDDEWEHKPSYLAALPRYLTSLDSIFAKAMKRDEAQLVLSLLGIRGMNDAGWEPYDTTVDARPRASDRQRRPPRRVRGQRVAAHYVWDRLDREAERVDLRHKIAAVAVREGIETWQGEECR